MERGESEWREVRRKVRKPRGMQGVGRTDWAREKSRGNDEGLRQGLSITTFYFTEFPENYGAKQMHGVFQKYGRVEEVVIPCKGDKLGRRYGFVRFFNVKDTWLFATMLDNIIIGRQKLYVNLPRFAREVPKNQQQACTGSGGGGVPKGHARSTAAWRQRTQGHTYANIVKGRGATMGIKKIVKKQPTWRQISANVVFQTGEDMKEKMSKAFVGEMINPGESSHPYMFLSYLEYGE